jgi:hypothetical protein
VHPGAEQLDALADLVDRARGQIISVVEPISMPPVASATRCEEIRLSSIISTRITDARSGMSAVIPRSFSTARQ